MITIKGRVTGDKEMREIIKAINKQWGAKSPGGKGENKALWAMLLAGQDGLLEMARARIPVRTGKLRSALQKRTGYNVAGPVVGIGYKVRGRGRVRGVHLRQVYAAEYDVRQGGPFANALRHLVNTQPPAIIARARKEGRLQMEKVARKAAQRYGRNAVKYRRQRVR